MNIEEHLFQKKLEFPTKEFKDFHEKAKNGDPIAQIVKIK